MIRIEIIANQAIEEDIVEVLSAHGFGENFTSIFPAYGRGSHGRREGSAVWPEENVVFLIMMEEERFSPLLPDLKTLKVKFAREGFRCYVQRDIVRVL